MFPSTVLSVSLYLPHRLSTGRRCFGLFHPSLGPHLPAAFVHIALLTSAPQSLSRIFGPDADTPDEAKSTCAVFYAISVTQAGLAGTQLGYQLILNAVDRIQHTIPQIQRFVTLSPMPKLRSFLADAVSNDQSDFIKYCASDLGVAVDKLRSLLEHVLACKSAAELNHTTCVPSQDQSRLVRIARLYLDQTSSSRGVAFDPVCKYVI
jgi:malonyl-CoA decarboxylase